MTRKLAPVTSWVIIASLLGTMCASLTFSRRAAAQSNTENGVETTEAKYPLLSKFATDLTLRALHGKLEASREH